MDEERIGLVLAKTAELRAKIIRCIHKTTSKEGKMSESRDSEAENQDYDVEEEAESLALQQRQWYDKESALADIEDSQKKLLKELKEYKGKDLEVINEAIAFASVTEDNNDLLLPPYPSRPSHPIVSENGYMPTFSSTRKFPHNGGVKNLDDSSNNLSESNQRRSGSWGPFRSVKVLMGTAAKTALTVVGVITILSLAGFEPRLRKRDNNQFKLFDLFQLNNVKGTNVECPPGKVAVMENGETRCVVKERVEIPFESVVATPNVSYGCG
ncbi:hypothetical protein DH2020_029430 [Rehmannia glutinosa]|uniref:Plastid division protein PDV2 n=1 Tax=Rehmannia glutinosa TaxID=99300 RepID=A0ABR0VNN7_REHGL